MSAITYATF